MLSNVKNKINEFIDAQSYDWSDINVSVESVKCSRYLEKFGFKKDDDYSIEDIEFVYNDILRDIENAVEFDPDGECDI